MLLKHGDCLVNQIWDTHPLTFVDGFIPQIPNLPTYDSPQKVLHVTQHEMGYLIKTFGSTLMLVWEFQTRWSAIFRISFTVVFSMFDEILEWEVMLDR